MTMLRNGFERRRNRRAQIYDLPEERLVAAFQLSGTIPFRPFLEGASDLLLPEGSARLALRLEDGNAISGTTGLYPPHRHIDGVVARYLRTAS